MSMIIATLTFLLITLHDDDDDDDYDDDNDDDDDYYYDDNDEYLQHPAALDSSSLLGQSSCVSHSQDPGIHLKLEHLYSSGGQTRSLSANKATLIIFLAETWLFYLKTQRRSSRIPLLYELTSVSSYPDF